MKLAAVCAVLLAILVRSMDAGPAIGITRRDSPALTTVALKRWVAIWQPNETNFILVRVSYVYYIRRLDTKVSPIRYHYFRISYIVHFSEKSP